ncbi:MAG: thiamine pyrophosphate-dependent enzyme, partial [Aquihabitans sp.]
PIRPPHTSRAAMPRAGASQLDEAAALLSGAQRPLVFAGTGVDRAGANEAAAALAELLGCPLVTSMAGRAAASAAHPNYVTGFGPGGDLARSEADVFVVAGSRLGNLDTPFDKYWGDPSGQRLIQIDIEPRNIGVTRPVEIGIVGDVRDALEGLVERLSSGAPASGAADNLARYRALDEEQLVEQAGPLLEWQGPGIHPALAIGVVGTVFGADAIYTVDGGNTALWAYALLPPTRPRSYHSILELGMLGTGIPSAVGAKLGAPDRDVVCVTGDGAAGFNIMEMQTAAREGLDFTTIVMAEGSWTLEEVNERALYGETFGTDQGDIRWDIVAQGLGCHGEFVERMEDLEPALRRAKDHAGPSLVCVRSDHDANLAIPAAITSRFFEVYSGPTEPAVETMAS